MIRGTKSSLSTQSSVLIAPCLLPRLRVAQRIGPSSSSVDHCMTGWYNFSICKAFQLMEKRWNMVYTKTAIRRFFNRIWLRISNRVQNRAKSGDIAPRVGLKLHQNRVEKLGRTQNLIIERPLHKDELLDFERNIIKSGFIMKYGKSTLLNWRDNHTPVVKILAILSSPVV